MPYNDRLVILIELIESKQRMKYEFIKPLPLSLYIHIPWCIRKCPYCDFNSHRAGQDLPEDEYINCLLRDLENELPEVWGRKISSIFIGGGTPSLFSAQSIEKLISGVCARIPYEPGMEITLEANPGTFEQEKFKGFRSAGINRLSIGIQSFQDEKLQALGRVHGADEAKRAIDIAIQAGFENFNLDLMHGLPNQTIEEALYDLQTAISFSPPHLSWYQLTLEPETVFAKFPPPLPMDDLLWEIQDQGEALLKSHGYQHYETSAFAKVGHRCQHNLNYWTFGDYLGIGAGAHGKITNLATQRVMRTVKKRNPSDYMRAFDAPIKEKLRLQDIPVHEEARQDQFKAVSMVSEKDMPFEFMMNVLRLMDGFPIKLFEERCGLPYSMLNENVALAKQKEMLEEIDGWIKPTEKGRLFLNDCLQLFLDAE